ncbi:unnamed protein product, partial [Ectocarpus sp. 13 AM-2016]
IGGGDGRQTPRRFSSVAGRKRGVTKKRLRCWMRQWNSSSGTWTRGNCSS